MKKIGLIVGKFLPLHNGHIYFINEALKLMDEIIVVVDESPISDKKLMQEAQLKYPDLNERTKWLNEIFSKNNNVKILPLSEENIPVFPNGWQEWSDEVRKITNSKMTHIFTSDISYKENYEVYFPELKHVFFDNERKATNGISSTRVRSNINAYKKQLPDVVKKFFNII